MKLYGGIDLHSNNCVVVLLDEEDHVVYEKQLSNDLGYLLLELVPYRGMIKGVVVESTFNWYWLVDGLREAGYRVHLANTAAIVQYGGLKYTDDRSDARWLAHLLRLKLLGSPQLTVVMLPLPLLVAVSAWVNVLGAWVQPKRAGDLE